MSGPISWYHQRFVHERRVRVLAQHFADLIAREATVLDVGCGNVGRTDRENAAGHFDSRNRRAGSR